MKDFAWNEYRWKEYNLSQIAKHGVTQQEAEYVVDHAQRPFPKHDGKGKWQVIGRGQGGRLVEVFYLIDDDGTLFIIHAMPQSTRRRRR